MSKKLFFWPRDYFTSTLSNKMVSPSAIHVPDWYKDIKPFSLGDSKWKFAHRGSSRSQEQNVTLKWCQPFLDALTSGYMITLPSDIYVELVNGEPNFSWKLDHDLVSSHHVNQYSGMEISQEFYPQAYKFYNNTAIQLPVGYSALFTHPLNRQDLPFYSFSGVVDIDAYDHGVAFPFLLKRGFEGIIPEGTPIAQVLPFKRESWISEEKPYDPDLETKRTHQFYKKIYRIYKNNYWTKKTYQ